jgi:hypothetical protein
MKAKPAIVFNNKLGSCRENTFFKTGSLARMNTNPTNLRLHSTPERRTAFGRENGGEVVFRELAGKIIGKVA